MRESVEVVVREAALVEEGGVEEGAVEDKSQRLFGCRTGAALPISAQNQVEHSVEDIGGWTKVRRNHPSTIFYRRSTHGGEEGERICSDG